MYPFNYEWEEIGPGYIYGPAFGHWDLIHQVLDVMNYFHNMHFINYLMILKTRSQME